MVQSYDCDKNEWSRIFEDSDLRLNETIIIMITWDKERGLEIKRDTKNRDWEKKERETINIEEEVETLGGNRRNGDSRRLLGI